MIGVLVVGAGVGAYFLMRKKKGTKSTKSSGVSGARRNRRRRYY